MPRRDGTGPEGRGAMTGRGLGPCNGGNPNYYRGFGYGCRGGRGYGFGLGNGAGFRFDEVNNNYDSLKEEISELKSKIDSLENQLGENNIQ